MDYSSLDALYSKKSVARLQFDNAKALERDHAHIHFPHETATQYIKSVDAAGMNILSTKSELFFEMEICRMTQQKVDNTYMISEKDFIDMYCLVASQSAQGQNCIPFQELQEELGLPDEDFVAMCEEYQTTITEVETPYVRFGVISKFDALQALIKLPYCKKNNPTVEVTYPDHREVPHFKCSDNTPKVLKHLIEEHMKGYYQAMREAKRTDDLEPKLIVKDSINDIKKAIQQMSLKESLTNTRDELKELQKEVKRLHDKLLFDLFSK